MTRSRRAEAGRWQRGPVGRRADGDRATSRQVLSGGCACAHFRASPAAPQGLRAPVPSVLGTLAARRPRACRERGLRKDSPPPGQRSWSRTRVLPGAETGTRGPVLKHGPCGWNEAPGVLVAERWEGAGGRPVQPPALRGLCPDSPPTLSLEGAALRPPFPLFSRRRKSWVVLEARAGG